MPTTCLAYVIPLDLITLTILGEQSTYANYEANLYVIFSVFPIVPPS